MGFAGVCSLSVHMLFGITGVIGKAVSTSATSGVCKPVCKATETIILACFGFLML